jgi:glycosyltransferase involved in cell wall biosynthesis
MIIQIPCYNEQQTLPQTLAALPRTLPGVDRIEILIIDDGSSDDTVAVARRHGVDHILMLGSNHGLSTAFLRGVAHCLELGADIIVNTDGDNQYDGACIADLIAPVVEGRLDVVVGARPIEDIADFPAWKKRLQRFGSRMVRQFSGTDIPDTTSGFRAYSAEAAMKLHVFNRYTYTLETIIQAGLMHMRIGHVPIRTNPAARPSRLIRSVPHYLGQSIVTILRSYMTYKPLRTFFYASLVPLLAGLGLCGRFLYFFATGSGKGHLQSLILAAVLLILAFHLITLGILSDLISANRQLIQETMFVARRQMYASKKSPTPPAEPVP